MLIQPALALLPPLAAASALLAPTLRDIALVWLDDGTYSHGLLLAAVALWLIVRTFRHQPAPALTPWWPGLAFSAVLILLYLLALAGAVEVLQRLLVVPLLLSLLATVGGLPVTRRLLFPLLLLVLAIPVWGLFIPPLQALAVMVVETLLGWQGIPAHISGHRIRIPEGGFEIAQGCSGLRYLLVSATFALLWNHLYLSRRRAQWLLLGAALALALLTNWVRIYLLILVGHYTDMSHPLMSDHNDFGWYLFAVTLIPLVLLGRALMHPESGARAPAVTSAPGASPLLIAALLTAFLLLALWVRLQPPQVQPLALHPPLSGHGWQLQRPDPGVWRPDFANLDRQWLLQYGNGERRFRLFIGWYERQRPGAELFSRPLAPAGATAASEHCPTKARCLVFTHRGARHQLIRWHWINQRPVGSRLAGKWHQLLAQARGLPGAATVVLEARCQSDCGRERQALLDASAPIRQALTTQWVNPEGESP